MKDEQPLSAPEIGKLIRAGKDFHVATNADRKAALQAAAFFGVEITTKAVESGFNIYFLKPVKPTT